MISITAFAIDNPDAPDYVGEFEARAKKQEELISKHAGSSEAIFAYSEYGRFLDKELNKTYSLLIKKVQEKSKQDLIQSQKKWLLFRDAEFKFVNNEWTVEKFGTSSAVSRGSYQTSLVKNRIIALLFYLKNYN